ncbi:MAG: hypothetical protein ABIT04_10130 [Novosphingobium sp.]
MKNSARRCHRRRPIAVCAAPAALLIAVPLPAEAAEAPLLVNVVRPVGLAELQLPIDLRRDQGVIIDLTRPGGSGRAAPSGDAPAIELRDASGRCLQAVPARDGCSSARQAITALQEKAEEGTTRLAYRPEQDGRYTIAIKAPGASDQAGYELLARERFIAPPPTVSAWVPPCVDAVGRPDQAVAASSRSGGRRRPASRREEPSNSDKSAKGACDKPYTMDAGGEAYHGIESRSPDRWVRIDMQSADIDSKIELRGPVVDGQSIEDAQLIGEDDDSGDGFNSRLTQVLLAPGRYVVKATRVGDATGAYTLAVRDVPAPPPPPPPVPLTGAETTGAFEDGGPTLSGGKPYRLYTLSGTAGERVTIDMIAQFDTYLEALAKTASPVVDASDPASAGEAVIARDDDGGEGTNARLTLRFIQNAEVIIRASALSSGATGAYTLKLTRVPPAQPAAPPS